MIYGDGDSKTPSLAAILQSNNLYAYCMGNPVMFVDVNGNIITPANIVGGLIGAGLGAIIGVAIANYFGLEGWSRGAAIAGGALLVGIIGWFAGPAIVNIAKTAIAAALTSGTLLLDKIPAWIVNTLNIGKLFVDKAIQGVSNFSVSLKHLVNAGGTYGKFLTDSAETVNNLIVKALSMANSFVVNSPDSFYTIVDMGEKIGTKGEQFIKIVFTITGKIITAFPV